MWSWKEIIYFLSTVVLQGASNKDLISHSQCPLSSFFHHLQIWIMKQQEADGSHCFCLHGKALKKAYSAEPAIVSLKAPLSHTGDARVSSVGSSWTLMPARLTFALSRGKSKIPQLRMGVPLHEQSKLGKEENTIKSVKEGDDFCSLIDDSFYLALYAAARCSPSDRSLYWKFLIGNSSTQSIPIVKLIMILAFHPFFLNRHYFCSLEDKEQAYEATSWVSYSVESVNFASVFFFELIWIWVIWSLFLFSSSSCSPYGENDSEGTIKMYLWLAKRKSANCLSTFFFNLFSLIVLPYWQAGKLMGPVSLSWYITKLCQNLPKSLDIRIFPVIIYGMETCREKNQWILKLSWK